MKELILDYGRYNLWANGRIIERLQPEDTAIQSRSIESSFASIHLTLSHIWDAQTIWIERLRGRSLSEFPSKLRPYDPTEIMENLITSSHDWISFIETKSDDYFSNKLVYRTTSGATFEQPPAEIILHCFNHSTYHRGQIITLARQVGLTDLPATDYIFYLRNN